MAHLAKLLEVKRLPLAHARIELCRAEAVRNGIVAQLAAGEYNLGADSAYAILRKANKRVYAARHAMDQACFDALSIHKVNGTILTTNDADDMGDALLTAVDRNEGNAREEAGDLDAGNRLTASDYGVGRAA